MLITLIAKDLDLLQKIGDRLTRQRLAGITLAQLKDITDGSMKVPPADFAFLISMSQDIVEAGDKAKQVRRRLDSQQRVLLCMPRPTNPRTLLQQDVDEIINLTALTDERISEHILGYLILKNHVQPCHLDAMRGATLRMRDLYEEIKGFARLKEPVLILGETGTGKRLVAQAIHRKSKVKEGPLLSVNCAAIERDMLRNELFGHSKGAFTGATEAQKGMIEAALDGTLLIDEIGDMDLDSQIKLLDVLDTNNIQRIGSSSPTKVNTRFLFATHRKLEERIRDNLFREDLLGRINMLVIELPSLRERKADIPLLVERFVEIYNEKNQTSVNTEAGASNELFGYDWPHNVRELDGVVRRAAARAGANGLITGVMLRESIRDPRAFQPRRAAGQENLITVNPETDTWFKARDVVKAAYFRRLAEVAINEKHAIKLCGLRRSRMYSILKSYNLKLRRR